MHATRLPYPSHPRPHPTVPSTTPPPPGWASYVLPCFLWVVSDSQPLLAHILPLCPFQAIKASALALLRRNIVSSSHSPLPHATQSLLLDCSSLDPVGTPFAVVFVLPPPPPRGTLLPFTCHRFHDDGLLHPPQARTSAYVSALGVREVHNATRRTSLHHTPLFCTNNNYSKQQSPPPPPPTRICFHHSATPTHPHHTTDRQLSVVFVCLKSCAGLSLFFHE